jgi:hypothetical protein
LAKGTCKLIEEMEKEKDEKLIDVDEVHPI